MKKKKDLKETEFEIAENLTPQIHLRLQKIKNLATIHKCWSVHGKIKYIKEGESTIRVIKNEKDVESLLSGS